MRLLCARLSENSGARSRSRRSRWANRVRLGPNDGKWVVAMPSKGDPRTRLASAPAGPVRDRARMERSGSYPSVGRYGVLPTGPKPGGPLSAAPTAAPATTARGEILGAKRMIIGAAAWNLCRYDAARSVYASERNDYRAISPNHAPATTFESLIQASWLPPNAARLLFPGRILTRPASNSPISARASARIRNRCPKAQNRQELPPVNRSQMHPTLASAPGGTHPAGRHEVPAVPVRVRVPWSRFGPMTPEVGGTIAR